MFFFDSDGINRKVGERLEQKGLNCVDYLLENSKKYSEQGTYETISNQ